MLTDILRSSLKFIPPLATRYFSEAIMNPIVIVFVLAVVVQSAPVDFAGLPCGLPSFTDKLTGETKTKMTAIWANAPKTNCDAQHKETLKLLHSLPHDEYEKIAVHFGGVPAFMRGLEPSVVAQFEAVWHDKSLDKEAKRTQFRALAKKLLNPKQLEEYDKFEAQTDERHKAFEMKLAALSSEARTAFDAIHKLKQEERSMLRSLPDAERREILTLPSAGQEHDVDNDGLPNFLEKADAKVQTKFRAVWFNTALDAAAKKMELKKLADTELNAEQKDMFAKHFADIDAAHAKLQTAIGKLSPAARTAYDKLSEIKKQEHDITVKMSHNALEELKALHSK